MLKSRKRVRNVVIASVLAPSALVLGAGSGLMGYSQARGDLAGVAIFLGSLAGWGSGSNMLKILVGGVLGLTSVLVVFNSVELKSWKIGLLTVPMIMAALWLIVSGIE